MNPQSLANLGVSGSIASTGVGLGADLFKGIASSNMYSYQAGIARMRAQVAKQNADYAIVAGDQESRRYGIQAGQRFGKIVAAQAASGIDVGKGSAADVQRGQRFITKMDIDQIQANAARRAYGFKVEQAGEEASAGAYKMASNYAMAAVPFNMASTLLTGSTSVASKWLQAKQSGIYADDVGFYAPDDL